LSVNRSLNTDYNTHSGKITDARKSFGCITGRNPTDGGSSAIRGGFGDGGRELGDGKRWFPGTDVSRK
jgi:hypothetical protein